ncbi:cell division protein FtsB [Allochromatium warmingii]|uniref:Cell division protein FtsB n=2 Tax=Allochromatium warmingii TaxID=61595 RepID=A0A1H3C7H8_ALLWA|nr:cell division protein FtsB [Allochromatium warmingii]
MLAALRSSGFEVIRLGRELGSFAPPTRLRLSMHWLILVLVLLLGTLQYRLWMGEGSLAELYSLKREIALEESELERLRARNRELQAEVDDLRQGSEAIEERARSELGMIKPGEIFIQVIERPTSENAEETP